MCATLQTFLKLKKMQLKVTVIATARIEFQAEVGHLTAKLLYGEAEMT